MNETIEISNYKTWKLALYYIDDSYQKSLWKYFFLNSVEKSEDVIYEVFCSSVTSFIKQQLTSYRIGFTVDSYYLRPKDINYLELFNYLKAYFSNMDEDGQSPVILKFTGTVPEKKVKHVSEKDKIVGDLVFFTLDAIKFLVMFVVAILLVLAMLSNF